MTITRHLVVIALLACVAVVAGCDLAADAPYGRACTSSAACGI